MPAIGADPASVGMPVANQPGAVEELVIVAGAPRVGGGPARGALAVASVAWAAASRATGMRNGEQLR